MAEVMVAMLILAAGSLAVLNLITASAHSGFRNEQTQVVSDRLQQELERIRHLPYGQIALTGVPTGSNNQSSPAWRVQGTSYAVNRNGSQPAALVYNGSGLTAGGSICDSSHDCGVVDPTPTRFTDGNVSGTIYRYVVWQDDPTCGASCPGTQDLKRVIVAITYDATAPGGIRSYQEIQTQVSDPNATHGTNPVQPPSGCTGGSDCNTTTGQCTGSNCTYPTPWNFWLTDTPCDYTSRQDLTGDHLVHNTNGVCGTTSSPNKKDSSNCTTTLGVTSCPPGSPDLMVTNPPTLTAETPLYDYATDVEPPSNADQDKGLQMPAPSSNGCLSSLFQPLLNVSGTLLPDPNATRMQTIHKWVSRPMGNGFNINLTGKGELNLWTRSINGASYAGQICFWIFERHVNVLGVPVDAAVLNLDLNSISYFTYSQNPWPTGWTELHIPLNFNGASVTVGPNSRLGLALQVEKAGTTGGGMQFLYDEPSFDSRLQLNVSNALLPF
jgi:hypothetical protein